VAIAGQLHAVPLFQQAHNMHGLSDVPIDLNIVFGYFKFSAILYFVVVVVVVSVDVGVVRREEEWLRGGVQYQIELN